jgi:glucose-6-phosphate 1-dehydrogenase
MIERLVLFGATGDLAGRFLLPALAHLRSAGILPGGFRTLGAANVAQDTATFRQEAAERLHQHAAGVPAADREALVASLHYHEVDVNDADSVARSIAAVTDGANHPVVAYLALPPAVFAPAVKALGAAGLPAGSRVVLEKPFGEDLDSAIALNALLRTVTGAAGEQAVFRVDHVLGLPTVQNLLGLRFANRVLEPLWNSDHIEQIDILWEETLALEGRAGFYDGAGALKDVMQNHMLQILSTIAMEPPSTLDDRDVRDQELAVLQAIRPPGRDEVASSTRRARYTAGKLADTGGADGRVVPDYAREEGVDPARGTETFAEVLLEIDTARWRGARVRLRAGKALGHRRKGVVVRFRPVDHDLFGSAADQAANELWIGIDGPNDIIFQLRGRAAGISQHLVPFTLSAAPVVSEFSAYGHVLLDILTGGSALSVRGDEAEASWRVMTPILEGWAAGLVPLVEYRAGSSGPPPIPHH